MSLYGPHFMLLLSIYVLYSNVTYIYPVSCLMEIKLLQVVSNCFKYLNFSNLTLTVSAATAWNPSLKSKFVY